MIDPEVAPADVIPDAHFGDGELPDWREEEEDDVPDDDEELDETPLDVLDMLGFDPKDVGR